MNPLLSIAIILAFFCLLPFLLNKLLDAKKQSCRNKIKTKDTGSENPDLSDLDLDEIKKLIEEDPWTIYSTQDNGEYTNRYQKKYLLTKNEWYEWKKLKNLADKKGLLVCPKVRLLDLIEPRRGDHKYKTLFYKVQAKHVDFVICDTNLYVKAIIELDDNSHNRIDRIERDEFVDLILNDVGYKVIRTRSITETTLSALDAQETSTVRRMGGDPRG